MEWQNGIDTAAHTATLEAGGNTIAVLGCGFSNIFPKENIQLYYDIIENNGLVISEYPPDRNAESQYFIERNRIVSGISIGILIVEAMYRSGTSVTARLAKEQSKKVFVLPHEIEDKNGVGTNKLIKKGAILVTSTKEIIDEFKFLKYKKIQNKKIENTTLENKTNVNSYDKSRKKINYNKYGKEISSKNLIKKELNNQEIHKKELKNKDYKKIYNLITEDIISIDELYKKSNMNLSKINQILFYLEIEGYIEKVAGGYRCILSKE